MSASTSPRSECRCPALPLQQGFRTRPASVRRLSAAAISGAMDAGSLASVAGRRVGSVFSWQGGKSLAWPLAPGGLAGEFVVGGV